MISVVILLAVWLFFLKFLPFRSPSVSPYQNSLYWGLSFVFASSCLYVIYYIQINLLPNLWWHRFAVMVELLGTSLFLFQQIFKGRALQALAFPFVDKGRFVFLSSALAAGIIFLFSFLTSSPLNWDVNAYNLARIPAMLSEGSTFLPAQASSVRQAAYSLGHDILFYPDLAWGALRGLPLICSLQFMLLLGIILAITSELLLRTGFFNQLRPGRSNYVFMIALLLVLNSNQQVMQAVVSKNDLFVTLIFTLAVGFGLLGILTNNYSAHNPNFVITPMLFLSVAAFSIKSYGLILLIPIIILFLLRLFKRNFQNLFSEISFLKSKELKPVFALVAILSISILLIDFAQRGHIQNDWVDRLDGVTTFWTNTHGSLLSQLSNGFLNAQRIFLQGLLFPLTTLKPYLPIGPELQSPISQNWVPFWLTGTSGSAGSAYQFELLFATNSDMAYPFLLFFIGLILGAFGWIFRCPKLGTSEAIYIFACSFVAFAFFSLAVLYQPWISRFLGATYIPLVPVVAVGIGFLIQPIQLSSVLRRRFSSFLIPLIALISFLPLISSLSLTGYLSKRAGMPQDNSYFYQQYLWSQTSLNQLEAIGLVDTLRNSGFEQRTLCALETNWTLIPLILTQASNSFDDNVHLLNSEVCAEELEGLTGKAIVMDKGQLIEIDGHQYIDLP